jgi:hypothetical protein
MGSSVRLRVTVGTVLALALLAPAGIVTSASAAPSARQADTVLVETAHSGGHYAATNTVSTGGGIYQDVSMSTTAGQLVCASAWLRTQLPATGASGTFALYLRGTTAVNTGSTRYGGLGNLGNWTQAQTCAEATGSHSSLRIQLYPTPGSPTTEIDDVNVQRSLAANGGFETGGTSWAPYPGTKSNFVVYANAPGAPPAYSGTHFAAANTASSGGGIYEDMALNSTAGQTVCGSARVRTEYPSTGAAGGFALWLIGSSGHDGSSARYAGLGDGSDWSLVQTCTEATASRTTLRVQFYPTVGSPTVEIDDVNVSESLALNGGFENGGGPWTPYPGTKSNYVVYANAPGAPAAFGGTHFAATDTASSGGGIIQDIPLQTSAGQTICGSAQLRTEYPSTGASGTFTLWLTGGATHESGSAAYSGLGDGGNWSQAQACVEATGSHTALRVQFYPKVGSPTVEMDDIAVDESLASNGGFEQGGGAWAIYPGTNSNYRVYANGQVKETITPPPPPPPPPVQPTPQPTPIPTPRARHALKVKLLMKWTWRFGVTTLRLTRVGPFPHGTRLTVSCTGRGCGRPGVLSARGPKALHRLLKRLDGHRYHTGDVLTITFTARGWSRERARVAIRDAALPRVSRA